MILTRMTEPIGTFGIKKRGNNKMAKIEKAQILDIIENKKQQIETSLEKYLEENPDCIKRNTLLIIIKESEIQICKELIDEINKLN